MIDIHTHIVASVDDGAESIDESVNIINTALLCGTKGIVLTPHFNNKLFCKLRTKREVLEKINSFINNPKIKDCNIKFFTGAEIYCGDNDIFDLIKNDQLITINDSRYVLIEFFISQSFDFIYDVISLLIDKKYIPIIAHCERYTCLLENVDRIITLKNLGCVIQVNSHSILTKGDRRISSFVNFLMRNKLIDVVASDTHDLYERSPDLSEAHAQVCLRCSYDYAEDIFYSNPQLIIENKSILRGIK